METFQRWAEGFLPAVTLGMVSENKNLYRGYGIEMHF